MYPILTRLGPFFIYSYTAVFAAALWLSWAISRRQPTAKVAVGWQDAALTAVTTGWLGARAAFIFLNWPYFGERPSELLQLWQGGLTAYGGLIGGLLGLAAWCWWKNRPFLLYANHLSPPLLLIITAGWAACWAEGCAYGAETVLGPLTANLPDSYGVFAVRFQTQLVGAGLNLLALLFVLTWQQRWGSGRLFPLTLLLANLIHFGLLFWRGDGAPLLAGWRLDSWLALLFAIGGVILLQYGRLQEHKQVAR